MDDSLKYLIHARITADGVVERSDVVGAVFGQTEGLLGDELDIRGLQESAKLGRLDVELESENGQSFGSLTIGSNLDKVETAILAAALETIDRIGPCVASIEVTRIEDVRAAKRREVVERAKELLATGFDESTLSSAEILDEVRESIRTGRLGEYAGLPAGPTIAEEGEDSDAVIVVEGRADVRRLLEFGIKNAIAVEGTNVPDAVADLTRGRTATAFLDGDRGGDLILRELAQVGDIDYVARAPTGRSVEDLSRDEVTAALREKSALDRALAGIEESQDTDRARTDGSAIPGQPGQPSVEEKPVGSERDGSASAETDGPAEDEDAPPVDQKPASVPEHAAALIGGETGQARLLDGAGTTVAEGSTEGVMELLNDTDTAAAALIVDGAVDQAIADRAAAVGLDRIVARDKGAFVKRPADLRVHTWAEVSASDRPES
ncbi:MAG: DNA primase DnaG [Halobacteriaceae archaeon]